MSWSRWFAAIRWILESGSWLSHRIVRCKFVSKGYEEKQAEEEAEEAEIRSRGAGGW